MASVESRELSLSPSLSLVFFYHTHTHAKLPFVVFFTIFFLDLLRANGFLSRGEGY